MLSQVTNISNIGTSSVQDRITRSVERISSGQRIVSARDDAAGLAIREGLRAEIAAMQQSRRNVNDGISMLQMADKGAQAVGDNLVRMKALAEQAASGTYSQQQKRIMQAEFDQLMEENEQIQSMVNFNSTNLLKDLESIEISAGEGEMISIEAEAMSVDSVDLLDHPEEAMSAVTAAIEQNAEFRGQLGAGHERLESSAELLEVIQEQVMAAESQISDADIAREMIELVTDKIIARAQISGQVHGQNICEMGVKLLSD